MLDKPRKITITTNGLTEVPILRTRSGRIIRPGDVVTDEDPIVIPAQDGTAELSIGVAEPQFPAPAFVLPSAKVTL